MRMRYLITITALLFLFSCRNENDRVVTYRITDSASGFTVRYLDETGTVISKNITVNSAQEVWKYSMISDDGGIVFVSANYKDPQSAIKVQVLIDGEIYKQSATRNDTISFVTVSGVIPVRE
jgi:hypothetical protein